MTDQDARLVDETDDAFERELLSSADADAPSPAARRAAAAADDAQLVAGLRAEIGDDGYSFVAGDPEGDVTVVEFIDYACGFCKRAHEDVKALVRMDGDIRYVIKEFPILGGITLVNGDTTTPF